MSEEQNNQIPEVTQEIASANPTPSPDSVSPIGYTRITEQVNNPQNTLQFTQQHYIGPIPPAAELRAYNEIQDGLANRVVSMTEQQNTHRIAMEVAASNRDDIRLESKIKLDNRVVDVNSRNYLIGSGIMILLAVLGFVLALMGRTHESVAAFLAPVLSGIVSFFKPIISK